MAWSPWTAAKISTPPNFFHCSHSSCGKGAWGCISSGEIDQKLTKIQKFLVGRLPSNLIAHLSQCQQWRNAMSTGGTLLAFGAELSGPCIILSHVFVGLVRICCDRSSAHHSSLQKLQRPTFTFFVTEAQGFTSRPHLEQVRECRLILASTYVETVKTPSNMLYNDESSFYPHFFYLLSTSSWSEWWGPSTDSWLVIEPSI